MRLHTTTCLPSWGKRTTLSRNHRTLSRNHFLKALQNQSDRQRHPRPTQRYQIVYQTPMLLRIAGCQSGARLMHIDVWMSELLYCTDELYFHILFLYALCVWFGSMLIDVPRCGSNFYIRWQKQWAGLTPNNQYLKKRLEMFLHPDLKNTSTTSTNLLPRPMSRSINSTDYVMLDRGQLADSGRETGFMSPRVSVFLVYYISNNYSLILHWYSLILIQLRPTILFQSQSWQAMAQIQWQSNHYLTWLTRLSHWNRNST